MSENLSVTYAGAGAGKTTHMIEEIEKSIKTLENHRFLVTITYTNSATESIRNKLSKKINIPENVFIGTIHSFMIRFFVEPFITNSERNIYVEKLNESGLKWIEEWGEKKGKNQFEKKALKLKKLGEMLQKNEEKGLITYDKLLRISREYSEDKEKLKIVSNRIQYLYIDEYQDTSSWQHQLFDKILKQDKTEIFVVGDPNQSIYSFRYGQSQIGERKSKKQPLEIMKGMCPSKNFKKITKNYRSTDEIITFSNNFNFSLTQKLNGYNYKKVKFINSKKLSEIIENFIKIKDSNDLTGKAFILSKENNIYNSLNDICNLSKIDSKIIDNIFFEIEKYIISISGFNRTSFLEKNGIEKIDLRILAIALWKEIEKDNTMDISTCLKSIFENKFNKKFEAQESEVLYDDLESNIRTINKINSSYLFSTIHKSKGLEAESVLIIAKTRNQLMKWLNATEENMKDSKNDDCRIGYVAFTRAKKLLVLCCLQNLKEGDLKKMENLNVRII